MPRELTNRFPAGNPADLSPPVSRAGLRRHFDERHLAAALKLSKGGLYHHFRSKDEILFHIMNHAMDITEARVLVPIREISDPEERLRALIRLHIQLVLRARDREITVILHENHPLPPGLRKRVNARRRSTSTILNS
jgi:AcrR family transcriptional regulator